MTGHRVQTRDLSERDMREMAEWLRANLTGACRAYFVTQSGSRVTRWGDAERLIAFLLLDEDSGSACETFVAVLDFKSERDAVMFKTFWG